MSETRPKILIVGKYEKLLDLISFHLQSNFNFEIISFKNILGVIEYFQQNKDISMMVADYNLGPREFSNVLKTFCDSKINVPFMAIGASKDFKNSGANRESVTEFISKNNVLEELSEKTKGHFLEDTSEPPIDYCPVKFSVLTVFEGLESDLYIKMPSGRFLKIFSEGDDVRDDDVSRYANKGVHDLFLKKQMYKWLLKALAQNIGKITENIEKGIDEKIKVEKPKTDDEPREFDKLIKVDKAMQKEINQKVKKTMAQVKKVPALSKLLKSLVVDRNDEDYYKIHVNLLNQILIAMCHALEWRQDATIEKLIFASYLHDITLINYPELAKIQTKEEFDKVKDNFSEVEQELYLKHPEQIKEIVDKMPEAPMDAGTIISQHHERPNGSGFPNNFMANRIHPQSALFIVAHDLVNYIISDPKWSMEKFKTMAKSKYTGSNFTKVIKKLQSMKF